jgi:hypothetical protein
MAPVVAAYQALRGVSFLVAVTFVSEVGDVPHFATPQQLMAFLGSLRRNARPVTGAARLHYEDQQSSRTTSADRGGVDLPIFGTGRRDLAGPAQGSSPQHPQHCLEGTGPAVRPLPSAHCQWQECTCSEAGLLTTDIRATLRRKNRADPLRATPKSAEVGNSGLLHRSKTASTLLPEKVTIIL